MGTPPWGQLRTYFRHLSECCVGSKKRLLISFVPPGLIHCGCVSTVGLLPRVRLQCSLHSQPSAALHPVLRALQRRPSCPSGDWPFPRGGSSWPAGANVKHHLSLPDSGGLRLLLYVRVLALLLTAARPRRGARVVSDFSLSRRDRRRIRHSMAVFDECSETPQFSW